MTNKEKNQLLKQYRNYLLSLKHDQKQIQEEKHQLLSKPKVLVLKKKFNNKDMTIV